MKKILFVCLGNICRSPMAEAVFRSRLAELNLTQEVVVDSAATSGWEAGNLPHRGTQEILRAHHIDFSGICSRQITKADLASADWIIGMDEQNVIDLRAIAGEQEQKKIHLFMSVVPERETQEVPDPYYTGDFMLTYQLINQGINEWLKVVTQDSFPDKKIERQ